MFLVSHLVEKDARSSGATARDVTTDFRDDLSVMRDVVMSYRDNMDVRSTVTNFRNVYAHIRREFGLEAES